MNKELRVLYKQDQADRQAFEQFDHERIQQMLQRDRVRRQRVEEILTSEGLETKEDYFHAAMIFQHGETLNDFWQAHELAKQGAELDHPQCRWLAAAAYDRWLHHQGKPQKYGTQYISSGNGPYQLWNVDPTTTNEERAAWNVPSLADALRKAEELTQRKEGQYKQEVPQARRVQGPQSLAHLEIPGLSVEVINLDEQFVQVISDQEQPAREEILAPDSFPDGWKLERIGTGYIATNAEGQEAITWHNIGQSELTYACKEQEVPQLEAIQLDEQSAILIKSFYPAASTRLFLQVGEAYYLVSGQVTLDELLLLATSVP